MQAPPKRRVAPGGHRPPPVLLLAPPAGGDPAPGGLRRPAVGDRIEQMGTDLRGWRRGGASPQWVRSVGWTIVIALLGPMVLAAWYAVAG